MYQLHCKVVGGSIASSVIQGTRLPEFKDGLRIGNQSVVGKSLQTVRTVSRINVQSGIPTDLKLLLQTTDPDMRQNPQGEYTHFYLEKCSIKQKLQSRLRQFLIKFQAP